MASQHPHDDEEDFASLLAEFERQRDDVRVGDKVTGTIVSIGDEVAFVDLGGKSEGTVDRGELVGDDGELTVAVGDEVEALVAAVDASGNFVLRVRPGRGEALRAELKLAWEQRLPVEGMVEAVWMNALHVPALALSGHAWLLVAPSTQPLCPG